MLEEPRPLIWLNVGDIEVIELFREWETATW